MNESFPSFLPGPVSLIGSGETASSGGQAFDHIASYLPLKDSLQISVLETPAGFEVNAGRVAGRVADFMSLRLQNYHPVVSRIAARQRGTPFSPDSPEVVEPLYTTDLVFLGPGSPTYTVRQLSGSLTWQVTSARQRQGAALVTASAAVISLGAYSLPVYEIYKVGEDPHWKPGLDFFGPYGLKLALVPHWNNQEGGAEVDTSHCFMGAERFAALCRLLPEDVTIVGVDEHTTLTVDLAAETCRVLGVSEVHLLNHAGVEQSACRAGCSFSIYDLGNYHPLADPSAGLPSEVWARAAKQDSAPAIPPEVTALAEERKTARQAKDWARADQLRDQISALGYQVRDTPSGWEVFPS